MEAPDEGGCFPCGLDQPVNAPPQVCVPSRGLFQDMRFSTIRRDPSPLSSLMIHRYLRRFFRRRR
jgi:hypothetical protein